MQLFLIPLLYFLGAKTGVALTVMPEGIAILWPPNGILLAALIRYRGRGFLPLAGLILVAEVAADWPTFGPHEALLFGLNNIAEAGIAYALLRRWRFDPRFAGPADLFKFTLAGPILAAFLAAASGALIYSVFRGAHTDYLVFLRILWFGDALGLMIVAPLILSAWYRLEPDSRANSPSLLPDGLMGLGALAVLGLLVASRDGELMGTHIGPVLLLPFVIYVAARFAVFPTACTVMAVALVVLVLTTLGRNPFGHAEPRDAVIYAQEFIFIMGTLALSLAALMASLRAGRRELERAHAELNSRALTLERNNRELGRAEAEVVALNEALEQRVRDRTRELEHALAQVKRLQGLMPICAWCKKVRDDKDYWHSVEDYITDRSEAHFSHSICPDCFERTVEDAEGLGPLS
jgi:integral membrane sensor domain MASE1